MHSKFAPIISIFSFLLDFDKKKRFQYCRFFSISYGSVCLCVFFSIQGYGCQDDTIFCGVFDGHGQWGHYVAKAVRESLPQQLLCRWQEAVALTSLIDGEKRLGDCQFDLLRQSYLAAAAAVDEELRRSRRLDAVNSGCTALSIVKQGDLMVVANVGDSRAVLATTSDDGDVTAVQLTVDFKPDLPRKSS
uniref:protein-serine/threonine phosphatase n=1 Tax=Aegilops tauschii subsp. strangulata TaxID=200361 RepID=A0A452YXU5_AEGTS